jgi:hypothetical protein
LTDCGVLLVVDSPTFVHERDGLAMRDRDRKRLAAEYHVADPILPGEGFLTFARLSTCAAELGRRVRFFRSPEGARRRLQRLMSVTRTGHGCPAQFGVWMAA